MIQADSISLSDCLNMITNTIVEGHLYQLIRLVTLRIYSYALGILIIIFLHAAHVFIRNTTDLRIESIQYAESIQLPLHFLPSSFEYTHPIELRVGPLGS